MGRKGCSMVGVTIRNLLNQEPITTRHPAKNAGSGFLPFLDKSIRMGNIMELRMANQNIGANSPVNNPCK